MVTQALDGDFATAADLLVWMPSHETANSLGSAKDSNGRPVSPLMWRANRLADVLAKAAASTRRLPTWATKLVAAAGALVKHSAARLGVATQRANNYSVEVFTPEGTLVKQILRDSTAERPQWRHKRKAASSDSRQTEAAPRRTAAAKDELPDRPRKVAARAVSRSATTAASSALTRKRRATLDVQQLREQLADEERVAGWLASRRLAASNAPNAQQRLENLRERLRSRDAH